MTHFSKKTIPTILFAALLSACGGQSVTDSATASSVQKTAQTSQAAPILSPTSSSDLLASLAAVYPNGQISATSAAQAAKELAQNPAVLHVTAANAATAQNAKSASVQAQAVAADYKAVNRIQNTTLTGAYFFTIYDTEQAAALAGNPNWKLEGAAFWASLASGTGLNPVHRFRNNLNGSYLYTIYEAEKTDIQTNYASTFAYEGVAWYAQQNPGAGWSPLYRFRNLLNGTYLFSAYEAEKDAIVANYSAVFKLEGVAYYVRQDAPSPVASCTPANQGTAGYGLVFKLCNGAVAEYYDKTECVKDLATGLIWEGKPTDGARANTNTYSNYDSTLEAQVKVFTSALYDSYSPPTQSQIDASTNSIGFKNAVNTSNLCGSTSWRLPTQTELQGLVKATETPTISNAWFPNTGAVGYWTSTRYLTGTNNNVSFAFWVPFFSGPPSSTSVDRGNTIRVRLVRSPS